MASTYSDLKIELIGTGDQSGVWGITTNTNLGTAIEEAIVGYATANFTTDADLTLTLVDTNATQIARNLVLNVTSSVSLTTSRSLIVPTIQKPYYIFNNTSGSQAITVKTLLGTGVVVPNGGKALIYTDGTNVVPAINSLPVSSTVTYKLPTTDGSSGAFLSTNGSGTLSWGSVSVSTPFTVVGDATGGAEIRLPEDTDNGSNYVALKSPDSVAANVTYVLPGTDGAAGTLLATDGSGNLSWSSPAGETFIETVTTIGTISTGTYSLSISGATVYDITLGTNVTLTFTGGPAAGFTKPITLIVRQPAVSPGKTLTVTGAKYTDGTAPILSTGANQVDVLTFFSTDGGTTYFGTYAMANVS